MVKVENRVLGLIVRVYGKGLRYVFWIRVLGFGLRVKYGVCVLG